MALVGRVLPFGLVVSVAVAVACTESGRGDDISSEVPITTSSEQARAAYLEGRSLQERLRAADARERFEAAVAADPAFTLAHLGLATTAPTTQEFFSAAARAEELSASSSDGERLQVEAFIAGVNGEPERQLALLEELAGRYPDDARVHQQLANYHFFTRQDYALAADHLECAIELDPKFSPAYNLLGYSRRFLHDYGGAERAFRRYIELIGDEPNPYDSYAELLMRMGRFDESIASYRKALAIDPTFVNAYVGIANDLIFQGRPAEARGVLDELRQKAQNDAQRRLACTWSAAAYLHEGDTDGALAEIARRREIAAATQDFAALSQDRNLEGEILLADGRLDEAELAFASGVEMMEASDATSEIKATARRNALYDLARVELARGNLARARELTDQYRELVSQHRIPFEGWQVHELDGLLAAAEQDWYEAAKAFGAANQQDPRVRLALARALASGGQHSTARETCEEVANFNQLNLNYAFVRSAALEMCGPGS